LQLVYLSWYARLNYRLLKLPNTEIILVESSPLPISAYRENRFVSDNFQTRLQQSTITAQCTSRETEDRISMYKFKNWIWFGNGWQKLQENQTESASGDSEKSNVPKNNDSDCSKFTSHDMQDWITMLQLKYWNYSVRKESSPSQIISANREIGLVSINTSMNTVQCTSRETEDWISMYKFKNWIWFGIGWQKLLKNPYTNWICKRRFREVKCAQK
jgi:hypothetical protein